MKKNLEALFLMAVALFAFNATGAAQETKTKNSMSWELSGRVQLQHLFDSDIKVDSAQTNNGFRIRRGRLTVKGKLSEVVETEFVIEVRDNSPRLKDAEGKINLSDNFYVRLGQFKVPVWREELRSSGALFLIERSAAAEFLADLNLSARQVGVEIGVSSKNSFELLFNLSNGAGEGGREDAGRTKDGQFVNNGKLATGRINLPLVGKNFQLGLSRAVNHAGAKAGFTNNTGAISVWAPDFGMYLPVSARSQLDIEGGATFGSISSQFLGAAADQKFRSWDITGRCRIKLNNTKQSSEGLDAIEFAGGITYIEPDKNIGDDETQFVRFGPAVYIGKQTRIQINGEIEKPKANYAASIFKLRTQATFNF
jgi:hypothetical protein